MATGIPVDMGGDDLHINNLYTGATAPGQTGNLLNITGGDITLPAGTATAAPLTFTSGTNLTTPAAGALEYDGTAFYATPAANAREQIDA